MVHAARRVILGLALTALAGADAHGQEPETAPLPARLAAPVAAPGPACAACPLPPTAGPVPGPAPPACAPYEDRNGPLLWGDPRLDQPRFPGPGWIGLVEVGAVLPTLQAPQLSFPVIVGGDSHNVSPPLAPLNWTAAPRIEAGYRLPAGFGEFLLSYHNVTSEGSANVPAFAPSGGAVAVPGPHGAGSLGGGPALVGGGIARAHSRLNFNVIDLLYASHESALGPNWDMRWDTGLRLAGVYFDTQAAEPGLAQRATTNFLGGGIKGGLGLYRIVWGVPGLTVGGRLDGAYLLGNTYQTFAEAQTPAGGPAVGGASRTNAGTGVPIAALEAGMSYAPAGPAGIRFETGYRYEKWFSVGEAFLNRGDLELQTLFLRFSYNY